MKKLLLLGCMAALATGTQAQNVTTVEYFIDTDAGLGQNTIVNVTPAPDGTFPFTVNLAGVPKGYHLLYMRTLDDNGHWGQTSWRSIEVVNSTAVANVTNIEYFFDTDPGFGNGTKVAIASPAPDGNFAFTIPIAQTPTGNKTLFARVLDADTAQSLTAWKDVNISISTAVKDIAVNEFQLYPNPSQGVVILQCSKAALPARGVLTNAAGKTLQHYNITEANTTLQLNYSPGQYFLHLDNGAASTTKAITLQSQ